MRVIVTRPEEDAGPLCTALRDLGHEVIMAPLLEIVPREGVSIPAQPFQAVVATSANGIRALGTGSGLRNLPMLTVGPQSLKSARDSGFTRAEAHGGDVDGLAAHIRARLKPDAGPILYLSGAATAGDLHGQLTSAGFHCERVVLYDAITATSLGAAEDALRRREADAVLLYSPRSASVWLKLIEKHGLEAQAARLLSLCLSCNVAAVLPPDWLIHVAEKPENAAMMGLLEQVARTR
jgi:uroporphyrinogen-III synthase